MFVCVITALRDSDMTNETKTSPVLPKSYDRRASKVPAVVAERAYEVYSHLFGTSQSLEKLNQRGGFGTGELIAFLYAHAHPKLEWSMRVDEALNGMENV